MTPEVGRRRPGPAGITASPLRDGYTAAMSGRPPADPDSLPTEATVIGFAGPSGSGKTHLAQALAKCLAPSPCLLLSADSYYRDLAHLPLPERASADFDDPGAIEHERLAADLDSLREGCAVEIPVYDFASHTRSGSPSRAPFRNRAQCSRTIPSDRRQDSSSAGIAGNVKASRTRPPGRCATTCFAARTDARSRTDRTAPQTVTPALPPAPPPADRGRP